MLIRFPELCRINGLGQLDPAQLESVYDQRRLITDAQFRFAQIVDKAFANLDLKMLSELSRSSDVPFAMDTRRRYTMAAGAAGP